MQEMRERPEAEGGISVPPEYTPVRSSEVLELDMGDGVILYNHDGDLVHHLNPSAGLVWQLCDGQGTVADLGHEIAQEYGVAEPTVREQLGTLIAEFDTLGLVHDARREGVSARDQADEQGEQ
jgi:hypothetical protein